MDKRYQIFISSTYKDLIEERQKVTQAILKSYHFPIGMEMFHADNKEQWEQIKNTIDMSDYYVLIVGRYCGTLIEDEGISYTEKEYNYAISKGIPVLSFIISDGARKESYGVETSKQQRALKRFVKKVKKLPCEFWNTPDELAYQVSSTLNIKFKENNRNGWIKNEINSIYSMINMYFSSLSDKQMDDLFKKILCSKLTENMNGNLKVESIKKLISKQCTLLNEKVGSMNFYIKNLTKYITIKLFDEYMEIESLTQYIFSGTDNENKVFKLFPWVLPGKEQDTYEFFNVRYNSITNENYIQKGKFTITANEKYLAGGIGIVIPYDFKKTEHNITFGSRYHTDYSRFFHSFSFRHYCEYFNLCADLQDHRKKKIDKYVLNWEVFTPEDYNLSSKKKIFQTENEIKFSPMEWMTPGCGYVITVNQIAKGNKAN